MLYLFMGAQVAKQGSVVSCVETSLSSSWFSASPEYNCKNNWTKDKAVFESGKKTGTKDQGKGGALLNDDK